MQWPVGILVLLLVIVLTAWLCVREGFQPALPNVLPGKIPFLDESLWADKIANAPAPAGTDITGEIIYSNANVMANVTKIKQDVAALGFAIPGMVKDSVAQQVPVSIGSSLRDFGYPMTDAIYGQKAYALHSLTHGVSDCKMQGNQVLGTVSNE
jgi:hypothetical protein